MSTVSVDPASLARYQRVSGIADHELHLAASSLRLAIDDASLVAEASGGLRRLMQLAAAQDLAERIDALWRAEMRTTRWVGAVGVAFACVDAGSLPAPQIDALAQAAAAPDPVRFVGALERLLAVGAAPAAVAALVATVPSSWITWAARARPELVGPVDAMPVAQRYAANQTLLHRLLSAETDPERRADLRSLAADDPTTGRPRQFLLVDPLGDGRVIEVFGDLAAARSVGVVVPGADTDLSTYERHLARAASDLHRRSEADAPGSTAVIAWLGTDTPDGLSRNPTAILEMATASLARGGGHRLHQFVDGLGLRPEQRVLLVGHSYGSTTVGAALLGGVRADVVVVAGSPGMLVDHAADFGRPHTRFYAMEAPGDLVTRIQRFGADPARPGSGFARLETGGHGHSGYLTDGSMGQANVAALLTGQQERLLARPLSPAEVGERSFDRSLDQLAMDARHYRSWAEGQPAAVAITGPVVETVGMVAGVGGRGIGHTAGELVDDLTGIVRALG